ncbi:MAG TPA: hypothetical protein VHE30_28610 [Polyangiaceae bacterium]|nr:hypothetical protein [Polyangiaceae bacterium]
MWTSRFGGGLACSVLSLALFSCGGSKPEAVVPTAPAGTGQSGPILEAPLTPVAAPPELFAVARIQNAARATDTGVAWSGLPLDWRKLVAKEVPGLDGVVLYDAPVDFAAMLDPSSGEEPNVYWAVSFGARSVSALVEFLRSQGGAATADGGGGYHVKVDPKVTCVVSRALGTAAARGVCSDDPAGVDALAPYMTRGLPTETLAGGDLHVHVVAEPFRRRYGSQLALVRTVGVPFALRELQVDHPKLDRSLRDVLYGLADEVIALAYDLDRVDMDMGFSPGDMAEMSFTLGFLGKRSWTAQGIADAAAKPDVAPDTFWKLPADATSASYNTYADSARARVVAGALRELADGFLDYEGVPEKRRIPLVDALERALGVGATAVQATYSSPEGKTKESTDSRLVKDTIGDHVLVFDGGGAEFSTLISELVKTMSDATVRSHLGKSKAFKDVPLPTARERAPKFGKGLPKGSRAWEVDIDVPEHDALDGALADVVQGPVAKKSAKKKTERLPIFIVASPVDRKTFFGVGTDEAFVESKLAEAIAGTGSTLATRDGLAPLRTDRVLTGGFSSLSAVAGRVLAAVLSSHGKDAGSEQVLATLPHRGTTPMLFRGVAGSTGPKLTFGMQLPRAVVEDIVALGASQAASALAK